MNLKGAIETYDKVRNELDAVLLHKKELEEEVAEVSAFLIGYMEQNPVGSLESKSGSKISRGTRRSADIVDYTALEEWALTEGDDFVKGIWGQLQTTYKMKDVKPDVFSLQPNRRLLTVLIKHYAFLAEHRGVPMNDLLPPGLKQRATEYLILRRPAKKSARDEIQQAAINIVEMAKQGALEHGE